MDGGGAGDSLTGGEGADLLTGGDGDDYFRYLSSLDSTQLGYDTIRDFTSLDGEGSDDQIDLSEIDADTTTAGDQAFTFNHTGAAVGTPGDLWHTTTSNGDGTLSIMFYGDTDGDGVADFQLLVHTMTTSFHFDDIVG